MPKFSANLSFLFTELPFLDRFAAAACAGFGAVEFLFPYDYPADSLAEHLHRHDLAISVFNLYPGNWDRGDRGFAALQENSKEFEQSIALAIPYAKALAASQLHIMAGIADPSPETERCYIANIRLAADRFAAHGLDVMIEPINPLSMPNYFLNGTNQAVNLIQRIDRPNVRLQFDIFHHQITSGDVLDRLEDLMPLIGHIQIAGLPDRNEPDIGILPVAEIFSLIDNLGYMGWIGCEYHPAGKTEMGLAWRDPYL